LAWQGRRVAECAIDRHELVQQAVTLMNRLARLRPELALTRVGSLGVSAPKAPLSSTSSPRSFVRLRNAVVPLPAIRQSGSDGSADAGELFDHPDGEQHEDEDDRGEREPPVALAPRVGFFRSHAEPLTPVIGRSESTP